jgi:hypothetical protein
MLRRFHVNLSFSGSVVLEKKILNDSTLFLHICNYFPFEKGLTLYLNNFEFPSPKDVLYQI